MTVLRIVSVEMKMGLPGGGVGPGGVGGVGPGGGVGPAIPLSEQESIKNNVMRVHLEDRGQQEGICMQI